MKKLGYIICKTRLRGLEDFVEISTDPSLFHSDKPSLIVGLDLARENIENFSIIKKEVNSGKFWTFGKTEKRTDFERDIEKFYKYVLEAKIKGIRYYYVNFFKLTIKKIKNLLRLIASNDRKYGYFYRGMLYLYHENYVLGISLKMLAYSGLNVEKHMKKVYSNKNIKLIFNDNNLNAYMKQFSKNKRYLIPYFMSLLE